jgi:hypothetical protein
VSVRRDGTLVTVTPYRRNECRNDVFDGVVRDTQVLPAPTDEELGSAVLGAIQVARSLDD